VRILLDTCAFLWIIQDSKKLSHKIREELTHAENEAFVSAASFWEITIKYGLGKLNLPEDPLSYLSEKRLSSNIQFLPINEIEASYSHRLPSIHKDPFDRMLVAQSLCHEMAIATVDPLIQQYAVETIW